MDFNRLEIQYNKSEKKVTVSRYEKIKNYLLKKEFKDVKVTKNVDGVEHVKITTSILSSNNFYTLARIVIKNNLRCVTQIFDHKILIFIHEK